jgi:hypothetical protein
MKKVGEAVVLHEGWEMDNRAWVIEDEFGTRELRTTSHGGECVMTMNELDEKIMETEKSLNGLKMIKALVS